MLPGQKWVLSTGHAPRTPVTVDEIEELGKLLVIFVLFMMLVVAAFIVNDALGTNTRTVIMAKVVKAEIRKQPKGSTLYTHFTLEKDGYRWESSERIEYAKCRTLVYNTEMPIWHDHFKGLLFSESQTTSGMIAFCK